MYINVTTVKKRDGDKMGERIYKKYKYCKDCNCHLYHYRNKPRCGKCYLKHQQEKRERKGLK